MMGRKEVTLQIGYDYVNPFQMLVRFFQALSLQLTDKVYSLPFGL